MKQLRWLIQAHPDTQVGIFLCTRVEALTKFLNTSNSAEDHKDTQVLMESLGHSNPKYQSQDSQGLVAMLLCTCPQAQHGALQMLGVMQVRSGPCWGQRLVLPPVSIPAQAGAVPVSLALWLHWVALLPGREQPGELCEDCPCHSALFPQDMMGEVPRVLVEPMLGSLYSVHLEVQYKGKMCLPTLGGLGPAWASVPGGRGRHRRSRPCVPGAPILPGCGRYRAGRGWAPF